jgi:hypothetical protein
MTRAQRFALASCPLRPSFGRLDVATSARNPTGMRKELAISAKVFAPRVKHMTLKSGLRAGRDLAKSRQQLLATMVLM